MTYSQEIRLKHIRAAALTVAHIIEAADARHGDEPGPVSFHDAELRELYLAAKQIVRATFGRDRRLPVTR
jgi:hypothetical protein